MHVSLFGICISSFIEKKIFIYLFLYLFVYLFISLFIFSKIVPMNQGIMMITRYLKIIDNYNNLNVYKCLRNINNLTVCFIDISIVLFNYHFNPNWHGLSGGCLVRCSVLALRGCCFVGWVEANCSPSEILKINPLF